MKQGIFSAVLAAALLFSLSVGTFAAQFSVREEGDRIVVLSPDGAPCGNAAIKIRGGDYEGGLISSDTNSAGVVVLPSDIYGTPLSDPGFDGVYDVQIFKDGVTSLVSKAITLKGGLALGAPPAAAETLATSAAPAPSTAPSSTPEVASASTAGSSDNPVLKVQGSSIELFSKDGTPIKDATVRLFGGKFPGGLFSSDTYGTGSVSLPDSLYGSPTDDPKFDGTYSVAIVSPWIDATLTDAVAIKSGALMAAGETPAVPLPSPDAALSEATSAVASEASPSNAPSSKEALSETAVSAGVPDQNPIKERLTSSEIVACAIVIFCGFVAIAIASAWMFRTKEKETADGRGSGV